MLRSNKSTGKTSVMSDAVAAADAVDPSPDEVDGIDEEIKEERANAYVEHFVHIVQSTKALFPTLLAADEHAAIDTYLALPAAAQLVYSRLFQRKGPWFRTTSLSAIADHLHPDPESSVPPLQTALRALETASFIRRCPKDSYVDALDAMKSACTIPEIQAVMVATGASKSKSAARYKTKPDMLERLRAFVTTQRRIDGSFLPLATHHRRDPTSLTLFQIHPRTRDAFYRMHRLMYMTLSLPVQPTLKRATWGDWQRAVCRYEPTAWPGLLVTFGKVAAFPKVTLAAPSRPLFPTLQALVAYECASVLRHATRLIVDGVHLDHLLPSSARGLTADWLDVRPPTLLAFAGAASPSISSFSSSQPTKADFCDNVHAFLQSVDNMDTFVGELRACLASSLHLTREDDNQRRVFLEPYDATYALARSMDLVVGVYEKLGEYDKALVLLQELLATSVLGHKRGSWYTRLAINLEMHMKQPTDARAICDTALSDPRVFPADRMDLLRRHRRLAKSPTTEDKEVVVEGCYPTHTIDGRPLNRAVGEKSRFIGYDDDSVTVEALVLQHYKSQGWHGAHDEGAWFRSLLGLLLWDVMFLNDVPDVFQTPFQSRPLDMDMRYSDHFYNARAAAIDAVVMKLRASSALDLCAWIAATWHAHQGTQCWLVRWEGTLTLPYMQLMAIGIGAPALAAIVQVWVKHLETSGLPDLFMLRVVARDMGLPAHLVDRHTNCVDIPAWSAMEGGGDIDAIMGQHQTVEAQFVEVKGPRDRLSDTQIVWLDRLNAAGIASVVCYVQEPPTKKKKKTHEEDKPTTDPPTCTTGTSKTKRSKGIPPPHVPIELFDY